MSSQRKLYRLPQQGKLKGVCAGIAWYFDVPVLLVRAITVLSLFCGLFMITLVVYAILASVLDEMPQETQQQTERKNATQQLAEAAQLLAESERRLRDMERYVTSDTFSVRSRFRQL